MPGARSVIAMALPMNVDAIYDFLSKKSPAPHNLDQFLNYQRLQRIGKNLADYLVSQGIDPARFITETVLPPEERQNTDDPSLQSLDRFVELTLITAGR